MGPSQFPLWKNPQEPPVDTLRLGWSQIPPDHCFLLTSAPPLVSEFLELFTKRSFWITRLCLNPSLSRHLSPAESGGSPLEEATMSKQKQLPKLVDFQVKATNTPKHTGFVSELEWVKICSLLKSQIKWNLQHLYTTKANRSLSTDWTCHTSQGSLCNLLSQQ